MHFNYYQEPIEEMGEPASDLENAIEMEITLYENDPLPDGLPDYLLIQDDYLEKELERQEQQKQQDISHLFEPKIP